MRFFRYQTPSIGCSANSRPFKGGSNLGDKKDNYLADNPVKDALSGVVWVIECRGFPAEAMVKKDGHIYIGTSGWYYDHWRGPFYPEDLPKDEFLPFYAERFKTVEINNSFYRLPEEKTFAAWKEKVPRDFVFSIKASRLITHLKKLKDPEKTLPLFLERIKTLGHKQGPVLFQLPPNWKMNIDRLKEFLSALPKDLPCAFEFRDTSWFDDATYKALSDHNAALCVYDFNFIQSPQEVTADFAYIRLHGPAGSYAGSYSEEALSEWAKLFAKWIKEVKGIYCYFDNDQAGYAAKNAQRLGEMVRKIS